MTTNPPSSDPQAGPDSTPGPVLTARHALILIMAVVTAVIAGGLLWMASSSLPLAVLTGGTAFAGSWRFYDSLIA